MLLLGTALPCIGVACLLGARSAVARSMLPSRLPMGFSWGLGLFAGRPLARQWAPTPRDPSPFRKWVPPAVPNSGTHSCRGSSLKRGSSLCNGKDCLSFGGGVLKQNFIGGATPALLTSFS